MLTCAASRCCFAIGVSNIILFSRHFYYLPWKFLMGKTFWQNFINKKKKKELRRKKRAAFRFLTPGATNPIITPLLPLCYNWFSCPLYLSIPAPVGIYASRHFGFRSCMMCGSILLTTGWGVSSLVDASVFYLLFTYAIVGESVPL